MKLVVSLLLFSTVVAADECWLCGRDESLADSRDDFLVPMVDGGGLLTCSQLALWLLEEDSKSESCWAAQEAHQPLCCGRDAELFLPDDYFVEAATGLRGSRSRDLSVWSRPTWNTRTYGTTRQPNKIGTAKTSTTGYSTSSFLERANPKPQFNLGLASSRTSYNSWSKPVTQPAVQTRYPVQQPKPSTSAASPWSRPVSAWTNSASRTPSYPSRYPAQPKQPTPPVQQRPVQQVAPSRPVQQQQVPSRPVQNIPSASSSGNNNSKVTTFANNVGGNQVAFSNNQGVRTTPAAASNNSNNCSLCRDRSYPKMSSQGVVIGHMTFQFTGSCGQLFDEMAKLPGNHQMCKVSQATFDWTCGCNPNFVVPSDAIPEMGRWSIGG